MNTPRLIEALIICPNDVEAIKRLNSRMLTFAPGSRAKFSSLSLAGAGGTRAFRSLVLACAFEDVKADDLIDAIAAIPWTWPERTRLVLQGVGSWTVEELHQRV